MINFRYHLVSLVAVFLALTIGIALGSTVVKESIVGSLNSRIKQVSQEASDRRVENDALRQLLGQRDAFITQTAPRIVAGTLTGRQETVVAERGFDAGTARSVVQLAQAGGGDVPAIVWLENKFALDTPARRNDLRAALHLTVSDADLRGAALGELVGRLRGRPQSASSDPLDELVHAGFVAVEMSSATARADLHDFPSGRAGVVGLVARGVPLDDPTFVHDFAAALRAQDVVAVVGERDATTDLTVYGGRGSALQPIRTSDLADSISTVDDLDLVDGQVASILALGAAEGGSVGHYGIGAGASRPLPTP